MEEVHRQTLRMNRMLLVEKLPTLEVTDHLFKSKILSKYMVEDIIVENNRFDRARKLLDILPRR